MDKHSDTTRVCRGTIPHTSGIKPEHSRNLPANTCEICGKHLGNRRAYAGHMLLAHQKRVGIMAEVDARIAQAFDMAIALNRRLDRIEQALAHLAYHTSEQEVDEMGEFFRGSVGLKQEYLDRLYKGKPKKKS